MGKYYIFQKEEMTMEKIYIVYNPLSCSGEGKAHAEKAASFYKDAEVIFKDICATTYGDIFAEAAPEDKVIICGGDGTLNHFVNDTKDVSFTNSIFYFATGTGNDFLRDIEGVQDEAPICIDKYIKNLPEVSVQGKKYRFLNGMGYGIDGYCCEMGDKMRAQKKEKINYTAIAIKGLLFHYKPANATVIVDGKEYNYKKVWIAPTMKGRFYGGGMMPCPKQDRLSEDGTVSVMLFHGTGKISTLMIFPSLFKGEHVKHTKHVTVHTGKKITVRFDSPRPAQVDGETVTGVTEYTVEAGVPAIVE
jgi:diacylglycerol kinase family enzyme